MRARNFAFISALLVVIIHCRPHFLYGTVGSWMVELLGNGIAEIAVPFFFIASGYHLLGDTGEIRGGCAAALVRRLRTLLVPFMIWNAAYLLLLRLTGEDVRFADPSAWGFNICGFPGLTPLWYVRALLCLVACAPLLLWGLEHCGGWLLAAAFSAYWCRRIDGLYRHVDPIFANYLRGGRNK